MRVLVEVGKGYGEFRREFLELMRSISEDCTAIIPLMIYKVEFGLDSTRYEVGVKSNALIEDMERDLQMLRNKLSELVEKYSERSSLSLEVVW